MTNIEQKLLELRKQWKLYPHKRKAIELQARVLKSGLEAPKKTLSYYEQLEKNVKQILIDNPTHI